LQQQGYYKNAKVDGRWGPHTRQAVESFQQAKGLPATGELDQQTLNALGVHQGG
jgi:peptidoglycan hydrolase-like protein with peptidoglycan-binding domain